jgi:serine/threonine-protein kinase
MELADGGSLKDRLSAGGPLEPKEAAALVRTLALAVHAVHQGGVVHRDLKPGNVLFAADGTPKVADFGLAKLLDDDSGGDDRLTISDAILGTAPYMDPEQASGRAAEVGERTDVYALGAILYEALTGRPPFDSESKFRTMELVRSSDPERPSTLRPEVPFWLESICLKCLEKQPARRYASAQALADDLESWLRDGRPRQAPGRLVRAGRALRRYAAVVALGLAAVVFGVVTYLNSPGRALARVESDLAGGRPVDLIGKTGAPGWSLDVLGRSDREVNHAKDDAFTVHSVMLNLVELVPDPRTDRYVFSAQVRHDDSDVHGDVGLFIAHSSTPLDGVVLHHFTRLSFNVVRHLGAETRATVPRRLRPEFDAAPVEDNHAVLMGQLTVGRLAGKGPDRLLGPFAAVPVQVLGRDNGVWHEVAIEVTPERLTCVWDGQRFSADAGVVRGETALHLAYTPPAAAGPPPLRVEPVFNPRGGLGLYVRNSLASFRSVKLTPLVKPKS